jgi:hypothetical protein
MKEMLASRGSRGIKFLLRMMSVNAEHLFEDLPGTYL